VILGVTLTGSRGFKKMAIKYIIPIVLGFLVIVAWFFRYEITPLNSVMYVKLDRWTHTTYICDPGSCDVSD
jgi:hypothetical protein